MSQILAACVNKSGKTFNVYSGANGTGSIIGQIVQNEVFIYYGAEGSAISICFKKPNGAFGDGYLNGLTDLPSKLFARITDYPIRMLNGYYVFNLRRSALLRTPSGSTSATLASGTQVVCDSDTVGSSYPNFKHIIGTVSSSGGIDNKYKGYFVDMGFEYGSSGSTMTLYGTY